MIRAIACVVVLAVAGCGQDAIAVTERGGADHNRAALLAAARQFGVAGHTPKAFAELSRSVLTLRVGMDETVAEEAELLMVMLALEALADAWSEYMPGPEEDAARNAMRLCGEQLARGCGHVMPEGQAPVVAAIAIGRFTARARAAVANCLTCGTPAWAKRVADWEALDSAAVAYVEPSRRRMATSQWTVAGPGASDPAVGPTLEIEDDGAMTVNGEPVGAAAIEPLLAAVRREAKATVLRVHLPPTASTERLRVALAQAGAAGYAQIALLARVPRYPWTLVAYPIATGSTLPVRDADPVQVLARVYDVRATP